MTDVYVGQKGRSIVSVKAADGRETDRYDQVAGVSYESTNPAAINIDDNDDQPKDANIEVVGEGADVMLSCTIDLVEGAGEDVRRLQAGPYNAKLPPPGQAFDATFDVVWEPVPEEPTPA
jgi:hypothetical protein